jgi:di/tricarboxylate transporter
VIELIARYALSAGRTISAHIAMMAGIAATLSAVMNNVAALALLMPVDLQAAEKAKRSPALTLMPLSFASILGGMITLIGTPPNIVIAGFRYDALGTPYGMFDFFPVGGACAVVGVLFIATIGWRLIPAARGEHDTTKELFDLEGYIAEVRVGEDSPAVGRRVRELDDVAEEQGATIIGLVRRGKRMPGMARVQEIQKGDLLVLEANPDGIDGLVGALKLEYVRETAKGEKKGGGEKKGKTEKSEKSETSEKRGKVSPKKGKSGEGTIAGEDLSLREVVVPEGARIAGRSALSLQLLNRHGVTLLGVSRQGERFTDRVRKLKIVPGDVLLLLGPTERLPEIVSWLGCLPLAERGLQVIRRDKARLAVAIFVAAVAMASFGALPLPVALACSVVLMVLCEIVPLRQMYESIEWPVIVLLGSMIPIGVALEASGGTGLIAQGIVELSAGQSPVFVLVLLLVVTMTLSDVMNNTATAVIAAPVAIDIAKRLQVSPDPFLMGVAVAASCAFLTPIGHKNNTLIMGPGGYHFGDYWRMGLPLEVLVILVATPALLWVWPL